MPQNELPKPVLRTGEDLTRIIKALIPHAEVTTDACGQIVILTNLQMRSDTLELEIFQVPEGKDADYGLGN